jgi:hypothetical protein
MILPKTCPYPPILWTAVPSNPTQFEPVPAITATLRPDPETHANAVSLSVPIHHEDTSGQQDFSST